VILTKNISVEFPATRDRKGYRFRRVVSATVESGWESLATTAEIVVSKNIKGYGVEDIKNLFRRGDKVIVSAGYNGNLVKEFEGYISQLKEDQHFIFKCEDEMFLLKSGVVNFSKKNCQLEDLINACLKVVKEKTGVSIQTNLASAQLGSVRVNNISPAQVLLKLKDDMSIYSYFKDGVLYSGKIFQDNDRVVTISFDRERNMKSHSLEFKSAEDNKVKVKVTSVTSDGKKIEASAGDEDGNVSTIELYGIDSKSELQKKADDKLKLMKVDGFTGSVTLFGVPRVVFGDQVKFRSDEFTFKNVEHFVDSTILKYGPGAMIERDVKIGRRAR
jgi:hypothetical protein